MTNLVEQYSPKSCRWYRRDKRKNRPTRSQESYDGVYIKEIKRKGSETE